MSVKRNCIKTRIYCFFSNKDLLSNYDLCKLVDNAQRKALIDFSEGLSNDIKDEIAKKSITYILKNIGCSDVAIKNLLKKYKYEVLPQLNNRDLVKPYLKRGEGVVYSCPQDCPNLSKRKGSPRCRLGLGHIRSFMGDLVLFDSTCPYANVSVFKLSRSENEN